MQNFNDFEFLQYSGDIDPEFNVVEVTEEAKQELAKIDNKVCYKLQQQIVDFDLIGLDNIQ